MDGDVEIRIPGKVPAYVRKLEREGRIIYIDPELEFLLSQAQDKVRYSSVPSLIKGIIRDYLELRTVQAKKLKSNEPVQLVRVQLK